MEYAEKLLAFNATRRYQRECAFLYDKMKTLDGRVLDIGCGLDGTFNHLRHRRADVYGIDPSLSFLQVLGSPKVVAGVGESLPFPEDYFSAVYFMHSLAHLADPNRGIAEAYRVLKRGGRLYIITPNKDFERIMAPMKFVLAVMGAYHYDKTVKQRFSPAELGELVAQTFGNATLDGFGLLGAQRIFCEAVKN